MKGMEPASGATQKKPSELGKGPPAQRVISGGKTLVDQPSEREK